MNSGVGDIVERDSAEKAPEPPKTSGSKAFNKKWVSRKRPVVLDPTAGQAAPRTPAKPVQSMKPAQEAGPADAPLSEPERIHLENIRKLQQMSPEEIEREREEIFKIMDPGVLQSLLRRAELKEEEAKARAPSQPLQKTAQHSQASPRADKPVHTKPSLAEPTGKSVTGASAPAKGTVADWDPAPETVPKGAENFAGMQANSSAQAMQAGNPQPTSDTQLNAQPNTRANAGAPINAQKTPETSTEQGSQPDRRADPLPDTQDAQQDPQLDPQLDTQLDPQTNLAHSSVHFPPPPEELRQYFPDLPVETEKLAWMQPIGESEEAEYSSGLVSVAPSEIRFDFNGNLVTPRQSRSISTKAGLHHHGDAPSAAGYTLPELAHLARSSHSAQRAMAIQTAGRVLHKLRLRKFAKSSELQEGLEALVNTTRILDTLEEAADEKTRSLTVRTLATEALWLARTDNKSHAPKGEAPHEH